MLRNLVYTSDRRSCRGQTITRNVSLKEDPAPLRSKSLREFVVEEDGAALAEYGILVAFIAIVAIVAVTFFGSKISEKFSSLANAF